MARSRKKNAVDNRKIAIYARKSKITESGKSIEIQKEKCILLALAQFGAERNDILIYEDEGKSGFYADRPAYREMLRDIERGKIKAVICYKIDRISRRTVDLLNLVQQMDQKNIAFISVSDKELDTSSRTGKIMLSLLSAISEFERDIIAERITDNMYELAKEGRWLGGVTPLGFCSKKERHVINGRKSSVNHLAPVEDERRLVQKIYALFLQKSSLTGIANFLNSEGDQTRNRNAFSRTSIKDILQNPVYAIADNDTLSYFKARDVPIWADDKDFDGIHGVMAYNKTEQTKELEEDSRALDPRYTQRTVRRDIKEWVISVGKHKGFIGGAEWVRTQHIIDEISKSRSARPREASMSLLSGLLKCSCCGANMYVRSESGRYNPDGSLRFRYVCDVKYRKKGGCEGSPNIKGYDIDNFVVAEICRMPAGDNLFYKLLSNAQQGLKIKSAETEKELASHNERLVQIENEIEKQVANLRTAPEGIIKALYRDIALLASEQQDIQKKIDTILNMHNTQSSQTEDIEKAKETILDFPRLASLSPYEEKLRLLHCILEGILVKDETVHIFLKGVENKAFDYICVT